jgi:hypothetical protein
MKYITTLFFVLCGLLSLLTSCGDSVLLPSQDPTVTKYLSYPAEQAFHTLVPGQGNSLWKWSDEAGAAGIARLQWTPSQVEWSITHEPDSPPGDSLFLQPEQPDLWHGLSVPSQLDSTAQWLPLPRIPLQSAYYGDLLHFLLEMTSPLHDGRVAHWVDDPIPVAPSDAISGEVDLGACLRESMEAWNQAAGMALFVEDTVFARGVRLVHREGQVLHPPMWARMLRRDQADRPILVTIHVGETYDRPHLRRYAVRGLIHELGHALQLWGHSKDRLHILWESGPIVNQPSADEIAAIALWRTLPGGLDLTRYHRSVELDLDWSQGQRSTVDHFEPLQGCCLMLQDGSQR